MRDAVETEAVEPLELKGKAERVPAFRVIGLRAERAAEAGDLQPDGGPGRGDGHAARGLRVGASEDRRLRLVTLVGDAGVGKSRLTREFLASIAEQSFMVRGRCLPYGKGITFWPLVEMVRRAADIEEDDTPERASAKLLGLAGRPRRHRPDPVGGRA